MNFICLVVDNQCRWCIRNEYEQNLTYMQLTQCCVFQPISKLSFSEADLKPLPNRVLPFSFATLNFPFISSHNKHTCTVSLPFICMYMYMLIAVSKLICVCVSLHVCVCVCVSVSACSCVCVFVCVCAGFMITIEKCLDIRK